MLPVLITALLSAPNIVIVSMDTLRADHLGFYGHSHATSPTLDRLAESALVFDDMICEVPLTGPSFAAMMTSQHPRTTGVTRNGIQLPDNVSTVAEIFEGAGYETLCVTSNWTLKSRLLGLDRGFRTYDDGFKKKRWGILKSERDAKEVTELGLEALANRDKDRPLFAWFHYSDPHAPYKLRKGFKVSNEDDYPGDQGADIKVRYDSEIAYTDSFIEKLLAAVPKDNTYIIFVGDHGESLYEHDYLGHGRRIYQTGLKIPFMILGPEIEADRTHVPARGIDVGVTLLGLAGLEATSDMQGIDLLQADHATPRTRVVETYGGAVPNLPGAKALMADKDAQLQSVISGQWKLITDSERHELFDLGADPGELVNLADEHPERVEKLAAIIEEWSVATSSGESEDVALSDEDIAALEALGYIE